MLPVPDGRYAVTVGDGLRVFLVATQTGRGFGRRLLYVRLDDTDWKTFGYLEADNSIHFHKPIFAIWTPAHIEQIRKNVAYIAEHPEECFRAYERLETEKREEKKKHGK